LGGVYVNGRVQDYAGGGQEEGKGRGDFYNLMPRALHNPGPAKLLHDMINLAVHQLIYLIYFCSIFVCTKLVQGP
jgi:hypothetical protein